jgi:hypothetical protein
MPAHNCFLPQRTAAAARAAELFANKKLPRAAAGCVSRGKEGNLQLTSSYFVERMRHA